MKRIFIILIVGLMALPMTFTETAAEMETASAEKIQLVAFEPPASFSDIASQMGYHVGLPVVLKELDMTAIKVSLPDGVTKDAAVKALEARFPDLMVADSEI